MTQQGANLKSLQAIDDFRAGIIKIAQQVLNALDAAESDLRKKQAWLGSDQTRYWEQQILKAREKASQLKGAIRIKEMTTSAKDKGQEAIDERHALKQTMARIDDCDTRLRATQQWATRLDKEAQEYRGIVFRLRNDLDTDLPRLLQKLDRARVQLDQYLQLQQEHNSAMVQATLKEAGTMSRSIMKDRIHQREVEEENKRLSELPGEEERSEAETLKDEALLKLPVHASVNPQLTSILPEGVELGRVNPYQSLTLVLPMDLPQWVMTRQTPYGKQDSGWIIAQGVEYQIADAFEDEAPDEEVTPCTLHNVYLEDFQESHEDWVDYLKLPEGTALWFTAGKLSKFKLNGETIWEESS